MQPDQIAQQRAAVEAQLDQIVSMMAVLAKAVEASDLYLNSYDTSAPSRIKAETRLAVEEAMALLRSQS